MTGGKIVKLPHGHEPDGEASEATDGRRLRSERSREQIITAMLDLIREGDVDPAAAAVAERAGVGLRTVFRHFDDMDTLHREMVAHIEAKILPTIMTPFVSRDWRGRLEEIVKRRAALYHEIMPYRIAGNLRRFNSIYLMDNYRRNTLMERTGLKAVLPAAIHEDRQLFAALELAVSFNAWRRLRQDQDLSPEEAEAVMALTVRQLVAGK
ncbi:TetR/AcrR family transcriptional regulator [Hyphomonas sp.]|uniref:TetR/AcrR family transcriptional regulator n=1 Tax=Hyphomonas sp. TaxID=87 RepID=UPI00391D6989